MKSSYKLFGIYWDHKPNTDFNKCKIVSFKQGIDYKHPYCLFDLVGEYRTINISEILSIENDEAWRLLSDQLKRYKNIAIKIDFITKSSSQVASVFYKKKLCQIYYALQQELPNASIVIQVPPENAVEWESLRLLVS